MGTEAAWIPLVMAAVGTAASVYSTKDAARKQDNALARQIEGSAKKEREADSRTRKLIDDTAASSPEGERTQALNQYLQALNSSGGAATAGLTAQKGGVSDRYARDAKDAALGVSKYGAERAGLFATTDSARRQRTNESTKVGRAATDINGIMREAAAQDFLNSLKTQSAGVRNPYVDAFAGLAQGAAGAYSGAGAGAAGGGVTRQTFATSNPGVSVSNIPITGSSLFYNGGR